MNVRTYDDRTRRQVLDAITRYVKGESAASNAPAEPDIEYLSAFPLTLNDIEITERLAGAFSAHFGDDAHTIDLQTASEDFSQILGALHTPYTYWGIGGIDPGFYTDALRKGTVDSDIPVNHSACFAPFIQPTLDTGISALTVAALTWLGCDSDSDPA